MIELLTLDPKMIFIPERVRKEIIPSMMQELVDSINESGQIMPIRVRPIDDEEGGISSGPWALVAGFRRIQACITLGKPVLAVNYEVLTAFERKKIELEENLKRQDFNWNEQLDGKAQLHALFKEQFPDWTQEKTAKVLGESQNNLSRDLKLHAAIEADPNLKKAASKKAAVRAMEMVENMQARARASAGAARHLESVRSKLYLGDARDFIRMQADASVDLTYTDLPFGIDYYAKPDGSGAKTRSNKTGISKYDDSPEAARDLMVDLVPQMLRITKGTGWIVCMMNEALYDELRVMFETCCATHFEYRPEESFKCPAADARPCTYLRAEEPRWVWYRPNSMMPSLWPDRHAQNVYEGILVLNMGQGRLSYPCTNVLMIDNDYGNERFHAMQKPLPLAKEIIARLTHPGERVYDPTFGSGNHLLAATESSRDFRGSELNPTLHELAVANVSKSYSGDVGGAADSQAEIQHGDSGVDSADESGEPAVVGSIGNAEGKRIYNNDGLALSTDDFESELSESEYDDEL